MANQAAFTINGTPSSDPVTGDRQFTATNGQLLSCTLEANPGLVLSAKFEVFDPADAESPLASKAAPLRTWNENTLPAITLGPPPLGVNDTVTITMPAAAALPTSSIHAYLIRCTVSTPGDGSPGSQVQVFERLVLIFGTLTTPVLRKTIPGESTQARARAWSDSINDAIDAIESLTVGLAGPTLTSASGQYTVPAGVAVGDLIYATGVNTADQADSAGVATMPCFGIVLAKPTATTATAIYAGQAGGFAGMTPGLEQYVGTLGARVEAGALPTTPGSVIQRIGIAVNATTLIFSPQQLVVL